MANCYNNGIIYKLCCRDTTIKDIYIGSTCAFRRRKSQHKHSCNTENDKGYNYYIYQFIRDHGGFSNWDMIEIKKVNCNDKRELEKEERVVLEQLGGTLNKQTPARSHKESALSYYHSKKEQINEIISCDCGVSYTKSHKLRHEKSQTHQKYCETNEKQIERAICDCGGRFTNGNKSTHLKSLKHQKYLNSIC
jgi:hypothetical protein